VFFFIIHLFLIMKVKHIIFICLILFIGVNGTFQIQNFQLYSSLNTVKPNSVEVYALDYTCVTYPGTLIIDMNIPNFNMKMDACFLYVSDIVSVGPYNPYPDPSNNATYKWTTFQGTQNPLPAITIPNAKPLTYFCTVFCPFAEQPQYELSSQWSGNTSYVEVGRVSSSVKNIQFKSVGDIVRRSLFFGNEFVTNAVVNWNDMNQYQIPICVSAMEQRFKPDETVCLSAIVTGKEPAFLFFQYFSTDPKTVMNFWQTRDPTEDPYTDLSGRGKRPINPFLSLPTKVKDLPNVLYHTIYGEGGQGLTPPYPNTYGVTYEFIPCSQ